MKIGFSRSQYIHKVTLYLYTKQVHPRGTLKRAQRGVHCPEQRWWARCRRRARPERPAAGAGSGSGAGSGGGGGILRQRLCPSALRGQVKICA